MNRPNTLRDIGERRALVITGVEGGGVTLYGRWLGDRWTYTLERVDQTPLMLDMPEIRRRDGWVDTWEEALALLDRSRWLSLPAIYVHPDLRECVWLAVCERYGQAGISEERKERWLARWRERCGIHPLLGGS